MSLPISAGQWALDPAHSVVEFSVGHLGISVIRGRFGDVSAQLTAAEDLAGSSLTAEVAMASVDTGNEHRDTHLRSTDIFNAEEQPTMTFTSSSITDAGDGRYRVSGELSINGTTRTEHLDVVFGGTEDNPLDNSTRAGFSATGRIDRTDYGIDWNVPLASGGTMLGSGIDLTLDAQLVASTD
ncbi:MAG: YceI family protein [Actinomycetota bacterium]